MELCDKEFRWFVLVGIFILSALLVVQLDSLTYASSDTYDSGYGHGCDDVGISDPVDRYINQPGKGLGHHTETFMRGYNDGFDACSSSNSDGSKGKGLKVYLTVNTNLQPQNAKVELFQFDRIIQFGMMYLNGPVSEKTIESQKGAVQNNNNFDLCVTAESSNLRSCTTGYDSPEKKPEYVTVNLYGDHGRSFEQPQSQAQSQSSNNNNENNNALSQSQETTIIICNDGKCE